MACPRVYVPIFFLPPDILINLSPQTLAAIGQPTPGTLGKYTKIPGCTGILLPGLTARILRDDGTDADVDEPGELWLKGDTIALGYYNNEKANKESFRDGWLVTGDRFRADKDGNFWFADRAKVRCFVRCVQED